MIATLWDFLISGSLNTLVNPAKQSKSGKLSMFWRLKLRTQNSEMKGFHCLEASKTAAAMTATLAPIQRRPRLA